MKKIQNLLKQLPTILSSNISIFIYVFLFFYLVIWAFITKIIPPIASLAPSDNIQLLLGNYTNVLSALGASLAAGSGVAVHSSLTKLHAKHDAMHKELLATIGELHAKVDRLEKNAGTDVKDEVNHIK